MANNNNNSSLFTPAFSRQGIVTLKENDLVRDEEVSLSCTKSGILDSEEEAKEAHPYIWNLSFTFAWSMSINAACLLRIPDLLAREGKGASLSLQEIASRLPSEAPNTDYLFRLLRFLGAGGIFSVKSVVDSSGVAQTMYGLTPVSKWLVQENNEICISPMTNMVNDLVAQAPWHYFAHCILEGGNPFEKAHGTDVWSFVSQHSGFNKLVNEAMKCNADNCVKLLLTHYDGFKGLSTLVDVGGGVGKTLSKIVEQYPSIKGINYDRPHVVTTAPLYPGVVHIGGDMFESVPSADAVFMKWVLHDWDDEHCIKILKNCSKALPRNGKVIIVDVVLEHDMKNPLSEMRMGLDMLMMALTSGGRERTEAEWEGLLSAAGFCRYKIIRDLPLLQSVIEVFME